MLTSSLKMWNSSVGYEKYVTPYTVNHPDTWSAFDEYLPIHVSLHRTLLLPTHLDLHIQSHIATTPSNSSSQLTVFHGTSLWSPLFWACSGTTELKNQYTRKSRQSEKKTLSCFILQTFTRENITHTNRFFIPSKKPSIIIGLKSRHIEGSTQFRI